MSGRETVTDNLRWIKLPFLARLCRGVNCCYVNHQVALNEYGTRQVLSLILCIDVELLVIMLFVTLVAMSAAVVKGSILNDSGEISGRR